jgi:hypothetical protein
LKFMSVPNYDAMISLLSNLFRDQGF